MSGVWDIYVAFREHATEHPPADSSTISVIFKLGQHTRTVTNVEWYDLLQRVEQLEKRAQTQQ